MDAAVIVEKSQICKGKEDVVEAVSCKVGLRKRKEELALSLQYISISRIARALGIAQWAEKEKGIVNLWSPFKC